MAATAAAVRAQLAALPLATLQLYAPPPFLFRVVRPTAPSVFVSFFFFKGKTEKNKPKLEISYNFVVENIFI
jgi:hypothetical protein